MGCAAMERRGFCSVRRSGDIARRLYQALLNPGRLTGGVQLEEPSSGEHGFSKPIVAALPTHHSGGSGHPGDECKKTLSTTITKQNPKSVASSASSDEQRRRREGLHRRAVSQPPSESRRARAAGLPPHLTS